MSDRRGPSQGSADEAAAWLARLQNEDVGEWDGVAFETWLAASPENIAAYRVALSIWHELGASAETLLSAPWDAPGHENLRRLC